MIASLPMYDRPETAAANDAFWQLIRTELQELGFAASAIPAELTRCGEIWDIWRDPTLLLAQTCALPFRAMLHDTVQLVGTPDYGLPGMAPGYYNSVIIAGSDDARDDLVAFNSARLAFNDPLSQSGWAVWNETPVQFSKVIPTGAHIASAVAVADGHADLAAIDAVTWMDIARHDTGVATRLKTIGQTPPTPGLPYITARNQNAALIASAVSAAIDRLSSADRQVLHLRGLVHIPKADYLAQPIPDAPPT